MRARQQSVVHSNIVNTARLRRTGACRRHRYSPARTDNGCTGAITCASAMYKYDSKCDSLINKSNVILYCDSLIKETIVIRELQIKNDLSYPPSSRNPFYVLANTDKCGT